MLFLAFECMSINIVKVEKLFQIVWNNGKKVHEEFTYKILVLFFSQNSFMPYIKEYLLRYRLFSVQYILVIGGKLAILLRTFHLSHLLADRKVLYWWKNLNRKGLKYRLIINYAYDVEKNKNSYQEGSCKARC